MKRHPYSDTNPITVFKVVKCFCLIVCILQIYRILEPQIGAGTCSVTGRDVDVQNWEPRRTWKIASIGFFHDFGISHSDSGPSLLMCRLPSPCQSDMRDHVCIVWYDVSANVGALMCYVTLLRRTSTAATVYICSGDVLRCYHRNYSEHAYTYLLVPYVEHKRCLSFPLCAGFIYRQYTDYNSYHVSVKTSAENVECRLRQYDLCDEKMFCANDREYTYLNFWNLCKVWFSDLWSVKDLNCWPKITYLYYYYRRIICYMDQYYVTYSIVCQSVTPCLFNQLQYCWYAGYSVSDVLDLLECKLSNWPAPAFMDTTYATLSNRQNARDAKAAYSMMTSDLMKHGIVNATYEDMRFFDCLKISEYNNMCLESNSGHKAHVDNMFLSRILYINVGDIYVSGACAAYYIYFLLPRRWTLHKRINLK